MPAVLEIRDLRLSLTIGCTEPEKQRGQPIGITIRARREAPFPALRTDRLADTLDVSEVCELVRERAAGSRCNTVEHLAGLLLESLSGRFQQWEVEWEVAITKIEAPIAGLAGGYCYVQSST